MEPEQGHRWPVRPLREPEELLSSWLCRVAVGNGISPWSFFRVLSAQSNIVVREACQRAWVDLFCRPEQAQYIADGLGITERDVLAASAFPSFPLGYLYGPDLLWNIVVAAPGLLRKETEGEVSAETASLHFCPLCMAEDAIPHFRRQWLSKVYRYCPKHGVRLSYRCPTCGHSARPHVRREVGFVHFCHNCNCDLRTSHAAKATPEEIDRQIRVQAHLDKLLGHETIVTASDCGGEVVKTAASVVHGDEDLLRLLFHHTLPKVERKRHQKDLHRMVMRILGRRQQLL